MADHVGVDLHEQVVLLGDSAAADDALDGDAVFAKPFDDSARAVCRRRKSTTLHSILAPVSFSKSGARRWSDVPKADSA